ncbi:MAG TPA: endonuclease/exonuclease/phosphatase family protein, partial [Aggregatilineales bacterium]|nr:endonuclease/exonuclease/phosphatase family protein [Aggregatilineales bacterium]
VWGFTADPDETFAVVQAIDTDIIAFQELRPTLQGKIKSELDSKYPYQTSKVIQGFDGLALISRFPILESQIELDIDFDNIDLEPVRYLRAVVDINGQHVVVYVFHPPIAQFQTFRSYDDTYNRNNYRQLVELIRAESDPTLLLCDCNFTPRTWQYTWINNLLDDSFFESGWGFGLSYPASGTTPGMPFPGVRIDYIWHSGAFTALEAKVWDDNGTSDHHPMWARLVLHSPE